MKYHGITIVLSNICTAKCDMCCFYAGPSKSDMIDRTATINFLKSLDNAPEIKMVHFSGGEPFLTFDFLLELIEICSNMGRRTSVLTNGYWALTEQIAFAKLQALSNTGLNQIGISFDEFHQEYVSHENVRNILKAARKLHLPTSIQTVVNNKSTDGSWIQMIRNDLLDVRVHFIACERVGRACEKVDENDLLNIRVNKDLVCRKGGTFSVLYDGSVWPCCCPAVYETSLGIGNINTTTPTITDALSQLNNNLILKVLRNKGFDIYNDLFQCHSEIKIPQKVVSSCDLCKLYFTNEMPIEVRKGMLKRISKEVVYKSHEI